MSATRRLRDLGRVIDGRIHKGWPFERSGGSLTKEKSKSKGLYNPGVQCYRNAVLQCLLHTPEFFHYLSRQDRCATPGDNCVFCALRDLALEYWTNTKSKPRQKALANVNIAMKNHQEPGVSYGFMHNMNVSGQQDAHEYFLGMAGMLRHINNHMLHGTRNVAIDRLFRLRSKATWVCEDCGEMYVTREKNIGLNLPMPKTKQQQESLAWYIEKHYEKVTVQGLRCDSEACGGLPANRERSFRIVGGPEVLVIQLMRMRFDEKTFRFKKVTDRVDYPERLDLSPCSEGPLAYQLKGVVAHSGKTLQRGHYVAMVKPQVGNGFVHCNDETIDDKSTKEQILSLAESNVCQSYLLVYQKIGGRMANCI